MIPIRPQLFEFADPESVCRIHTARRCAASRDAKPWGLLAQDEPNPATAAEAFSGGAPFGQAPAAVEAFSGRG